MSRPERHVGHSHDFVRVMDRKDTAHSCGPPLHVTVVALVVDLDGSSVQRIDVAHGDDVVGAWQRGRYDVVRRVVVG